MANDNRTVTQARDGQIVTGIDKNLLTKPTPVSFGGETFATWQNVQDKFRNRNDLANQVAAAHASWISLAQAYQQVSVETDRVERGLKQYVMNMFGETSPVLADFGFTPPKRAPQTVEQKKAAIAKRAATRKARNTMGKKAKLQIKGTVPAPTPTPAPSPAPTPSPAPAPAPHVPGTVTPGTTGSP